MAQLLDLTPLIFFACLVLFVLGLGQQGRRAIRIVALIGLDLCLMFWGLAFLQRADGSAAGEATSSASLGSDWTWPLNDFFLTAGLESLTGAQAAGFICFGLSFIPFFRLFGEIRAGRQV